MTERVGVPIERIAHALRTERGRAARSLSEVAKRAGIAKSTLSQLESGAGNPSLETLWALATALEVPVSRLIDQPAPRVRLVRAGEAPVLRAGEAPVLRAEHAEYRARLLASLPHGRYDVHYLSAEPGPARDSTPHLAGSVEHVVLCAGHALAGPVAEPLELAPGDYLSYPADEPHTFRALEAAPRRYCSASTAVA